VAFDGAGSVFFGSNSLQKQKIPASIAPAGSPVFIHHLLAANNEMARG
jgi:hypothetical protein